MNCSSWSETSFCRFGSVGFGKCLFSPVLTFLVQSGRSHETDQTAAITTMQGIKLSIHTSIAQEILVAIPRATCEALVYSCWDDLRAGSPGIWGFARRVSLTERDALGLRLGCSASAPHAFSHLFGCVLYSDPVPRVVLTVHLLKEEYLMRQPWLLIFAACLPVNAMPVTALAALR